jgi:HPt (histidine-containing phosphotransfer) domain-containing protein
VAEARGGAATARLPAEVVASLRAAFAEEVAARLPRLRGAVDGVLGEDVLRDAHTLASSAAVVGEPEASRLARELETLIEVDDVDGACAAAGRLVACLESWTA